jgi:transcriptional regulator GlxA family with amidase domain
MWKHLSIHQYCFRNSEALGIALNTRRQTTIRQRAYLKTLRLQAVRTQLQLAEPATTAIAEIANRFGFQSLGHFSRDYKTMFGELPSETLKQLFRH